jgi:hypothetical protein
MTNPLPALLADMELERRLRIYEVLETARRALCGYTQDPCDCKYGNVAGARQGSEVTGCCELRDLIKGWTGWFPYHRGQSIQDDLDRFRLKESESCQKDN